MEDAVKYLNYIRLLAILSMQIILTRTAFAQSDTTICVNLVDGWNIVSLPVDVTDRSAMTNFNVPYVYEYTQQPWVGYRVSYILEIGRAHV